MPEPSVGLAVRNAWRRMRKLLFPFRPGRWLSIYLGQYLKSGRQDPVIVELRRLRPYYRGTRLLTLAGIWLILLAFVVPFSVIFIGMEGFVFLLIAYVALLVVTSILGMAVQSAMDAVFALQHERKLKFADAMRAYLSIMRSRGDLAFGYMSVKFAIDFTLSTIALSFFLPALLMAMGVMVSLTDSVKAGVAVADVWSGAIAGVLIVVLLVLLGFVATLLTTLPATVFYGYYTEEAVKMMQE